MAIDGSYLVSSEWPTLIKENAKEVIMDVDGYENYHDIYMVDSKSFQQQMEILIDSTIK